jgi:hypothetical protein
MIDLETELRTALRADAASPLDHGAMQDGVARKRRARGRRRLAGGAALSVAAALLVVALRPSAGPSVHATRPRPMFAINLVSSARAAGLPPDEALMRAAWAAYQAGDPARAQATLQRVLDEHPASPWIDDALIGRADDRFEEGDLAGALALYQRVRPTAKVYRYALYKTGWVRYNLEDKAGAVALWQRVVHDGGPDSDDPVVKACAAELARVPSP